MRNKNEHDSNRYNGDHLYHGGHACMDRGEMMYKIPKECTTADEIRAYDKGFNDGYWNKPFHDAPDYKRFDNLRCMYAN